TGDLVPLMAAPKEFDFRLRLEQFPAIVWATDRDLRYVYSRGAGLTALGLGADEVVGLSLTECLESRDPADPTLTAHYAALGGVPTVYEMHCNRRRPHAHRAPCRAPP